MIPLFQWFWNIMDVQQLKATDPQSYWLISGWGSGGWHISEPSLTNLFRVMNHNIYLCNYPTFLHNSFILQQRWGNDMVFPSQYKCDHKIIKSSNNEILKYLPVICLHPNWYMKTLFTFSKLDTVFLLCTYQQHISYKCFFLTWVIHTAHFK